MRGGSDNPLGARALYLCTVERGDIFLRVRGTNAPQTIGTAVSNGCARLVNDQTIELYEMVPLDTRVALYPQSAGSQDSPLEEPTEILALAVRVRRPGSGGLIATAAYRGSPAYQGSI